MRIWPACTSGTSDLKRQSQEVAPISPSISMTKPEYLRYVKEAPKRARAQLEEHLFFLIQRRVLWILRAFRAPFGAKTSFKTALCRLGEDLLVEGRPLEIRFRLLRSASTSAVERDPGKMRLPRSCAARDQDRS